jgi:hypothetical protein
MIAALLLFACTGAPPATDTPAPTARFATSVPGQRPTLPPSWTPTATPTITLTPTITATFTATATRTVDEICANFAALIGLVDGRTYTTADRIQLLLSIDDPTLIIDLVLINEDSEEEERYELPGGQLYAGQLDLSLDPGPGMYRWQVSIRDGDRRDLCALSGAFLLEEAPPVTTWRDVLDNLLTRLATTPTPQVIIVTATPEPEATPEITPEATPEP